MRTVVSAIGWALVLLLAGCTNDRGLDRGSYAEQVDECTGDRQECIAEGTAQVDCDAAFEECMNPSEDEDEGDDADDDVDTGDEDDDPSCVERDASIAACDALLNACPPPEEDNPCHEAQDACMERIAPCRYPQACWDEWGACVAAAGGGSSDENPAVEACHAILQACDTMPEPASGEEDEADDDDAVDSGEDESGEDDGGEGAGGEDAGDDDATGGGEG